MKRNFLCAAVLALLFGAVGSLEAQTSSGTGSAMAKRPMTVEDLFKFQRVGPPQVSLDGKQVVYAVSEITDSKNNKSVSRLWLVPSDGSSPPRQLTNPAGKDSNPRWSPDGTRILFESTRSGSSQLWVIGLNGGEAQQLTKISTDASSGTWAPNGKHIAFVSTVYPEFSTKPFAESDALNKQKAEDIANSPIKARVHKRLFYRHWDSYVEDKRQHLFVIDLKEENGNLIAGEPRDVTPGDRDAYPTSTTFSAPQDFTFSPDSSHLIFTAVPAENEAWNTNFDLCRVPVSGGTTNWETLTSDNQAADGLPVFSPDGKAIAFRRQRKQGYEADRWEIVVAACEKDGKLATEPISLTDQIDLSFDELVWKDLSTLFVTAEHQGSKPLFILETGKQNAIRTVKSTATNLNLSISRDGSTLVCNNTSLSFPAEVFRITQDAANIEWIAPGLNLSNANTDLLSEIAFAQPESVTVTGADGDPMQMWILKPPGFDEKKKWALGYLVHGGPQGAWADSWSFRWNPQVWAAQGYVIVAPNPRGSTGFGQKYTDQISGDWGGRCYEDLMAGLAYMEKQPYVDTDRMFSAGASFGGYMMNWFQGNTTKFKTLVTHCGVYNFDSMYATTEELWFDEYEHGGPPWGNNRESYEKHSPHRLAANFKTPMLIIHNDLDFRVPVSEGHQLFTTLQRLGVPSKFINFPDEGHWVSKPANSRYWHNEIYDWLKEYCPPGAK